MVATALVGAGINLAIGGISSIFGSSQRNSRNASAKRAQKRQDKYNKEMWEFTNEQGERRTAYAQEGVEMARRNQDRNIALQQTQLNNQYNYGMQIRQFEYDRAVEMQNEQKRVAQQQLDFNNRAYATALVEQENYLYEQNLAFDLMGLNEVNRFQLDNNKLAQQQRTTRSKDNFDMQLAQIQGLKSAGAAQNLGQSGRTAGKNLQAAIAENGLKQSMIAERTMLAGESYMLSIQENTKQLQEMSRDIILGRESLKRQDTITREQLRNSFEQANADALNNIMLDPVLAPALPDVPQLSDYAAEIQDVLEWEWTPEPIEGVAGQEQGNFLTDFLGNKNAQAGITMGIGEIAKQFVPPVPG
jgi:hypothetical protein